MNTELQLAQRRRSAVHPGHPETGDVVITGTARRDAQAARDEARARRERVDQLLGGLDTRDARNGGGQ